MYYFCNNFHNKFSEIAYQFMGCHFNRYTGEAVLEYMHHMLQRFM